LITREENKLSLSLPPPPPSFPSLFFLDNGVGDWNRRRWKDKPLVKKRRNVEKKERNGMNVWMGCLTKG
jgi:hypothetical protein